MTLNEDHQFQVELENARHAHTMALQAQMARIEAIRLAKETLLQNAHNKPVGEGEVTAEDIIAFSTKLTAHLNV